MSKIIFLIILMLCSTLGYSKSRTVFGTIKGDDGKPVEFCVIKTSHSNYAAYSNERGEYFIKYDTDSSNSLIFFCLGYETKELTIDADTLNVILRRKTNKLREVVVSANKKENKKQGVLGKKNLKPYGVCTAFTGNEWAILLNADSNRHGILKEIFFYITKEGIPDSKFRVHVYNIDSSAWPGNDLLDSNVILHANKGGEWVSVDLSYMHIPVGKGLFISMEWISGYGNIQTLVTSDKYSAIPAFNGQVLAFTQGYFRQGGLSYERKNVNEPWRFISLAGTSRRNILNPMIYATYTYYNK